MTVKSKATRLIEAKWPGCLIVRRGHKTHVVVSEVYEVGTRNGRPLRARRWAVFEVTRIDDGDGVWWSPVASGLRHRRDATAAAAADAISR